MRVECYRCKASGNREHGAKGCPRCGHHTYCWTHDECALCGTSPRPEDGKRVPIVVRESGPGLYDVVIGGVVKGQIKRDDSVRRRPWLFRVYPDLEFERWVGTNRWPCVQFIARGSTQAARFELMARAQFRAAGEKFPGDDEPEQR